MASSIVLSDNGVTSGSAGIRSTGGNDGVLLLQTTTSGGAVTTAVTVDNAQNVGVGVTPSAWTTYKALQIGPFAAFADSTSGNIDLSSNRYNASGDKYIGSGYASMLRQSDGAFKFFTAASGTAGNAITFTQAMTLDASGNLLVGQTTKSQTTVGFYAAANGEVSACQSASTNAATQWNTYSTGAGAFRFYVGMGGTVYATSTTISGISDIRLKENIRDLDEGLDVVMALKPRKFDWKEGKGADIKNARGFIAQEFEKVLPDMIDTWKDPAPEGEEPYKAVNANLIPTLVKAIQEQQALITSLTERITALEAK